MIEPRLASGVQISALKRLAEAEGDFATVLKKGDATSGAVVVKVATLDGKAQSFQRSYDLVQGARVWVTLAEGPEVDVDAVLARARARDPDLWVIELEDRQGRTLLDTEGLD